MLGVVIFLGIEVNSLSAANLVAHWKLDEAEPPYRNATSSDIPLELDPATTPPTTAPGYKGSSARLLYNNTSGIATKLTAENDVLKMNSFGFSFWIKPVDLKSGDNLIAKEIPLCEDENFTRIGWQVCVGNNDGTGSAPLEFIVRGGDRSNKNFFGAVTSSIKFPLSMPSSSWFHIAGGYDANTGKLSISVNGVRHGVLGQAGANNAQLGTLSLGSVRNEMDFVAFAALAYFDDLRIYDSPLNEREVEDLMYFANSSPSLLARWKFNEPAAPFYDSSGRGIQMALDHSTTPPVSEIGIEGMAARLHFDNSIGVSTRLTANNAALQTDSFGFSFWIKPISLNQGDNFIAKQKKSNISGGSSDEMAWQVRMGEDNGSGLAPIQFIIGETSSAQATNTNLISSSTLIPLHSNSSKWHHIAGGYDSESGRLSISVDGLEDVITGTPQLHNSDGAPLDVGTVKVDEQIIAYSASTLFEDLQIYNTILTSKDIGFLLSNPGMSLSSPKKSSHPIRLLHKWSFEDVFAPYLASDDHNIKLEQDNNTAPAQPVQGVNGKGLRLQWNQQAGISTRLYSATGTPRTDSFGFSFWMRPLHLSPFESIIAKEIDVVDGEGFTKTAWQIQVGADDGTGMAPLQLIIRGADRTKSNFYGSVLSSVVLPLRYAMAEWIHVAGGYDSETGGATLYVNGVEAWSQGTPGAENSNPGWLSVGSVRNGVNFIAYSAMMDIDELQLFDGPVSPYDEARLRKLPGSLLNNRFEITNCQYQTGERYQLSFNSIQGWYYYIEASTDLTTYKPVKLIAAQSANTTLDISKTDIDAALGGNQRTKVFFRVKALLEDPFTFDLELPPATILPFYNSELYVPQYHLSFEHANVGDPNGVIRYQNKYHVFTWDHASSEDLLTWTPLGWPMRDTSPDVGFWTGSVVVDIGNTSGFGLPGGLPPMVAIYTIHDNNTLQESVGIAYSVDHHNFYNFTNNPVVTQPGEKTFRDPDVFWDSARNRWFMSIARSEKQAISFYTSPDLKNWTSQGIFNADFANNLDGHRATRVGARSEIWEVPGLVEVPIQGGGTQKKWLLFVGAGTDKVQYFVGDFDGAKFTIDSATWNYLRYGTGLEGEVFADFENSHWNGWTVQGDAFGWEPVPFWWDRPAYGYLGDRLASSYGHNPSYAPGIQDFRKGKLTSPAFTVSYKCINFLIGGGNHPGKTCINLLVNNQVVRSTTGNNSDSLRWAGWNVSEYLGQPAQIEIVDDESGEWGRIYIDQIMFSNILRNSGREHANWVDYGSDFFAPKVVRDFDGVESDVKWIGWIGSWLYEKDRPKPLNWGKGVETIFRKLQLAWSPKGYQLVQRPDQALQLLRGVPTSITPRTIIGTHTLTEFVPQTNTYEIEVAFDLSKSTATVLGLNLCVQEEWPQRVIIGYNTQTSNLFIDRTSSGYVTFGNGFQSIATAPYLPKDQLLKLRIFIDQSSIEVFTSDGEKVLTSQIYPHPGGNKIQLFSTQGAASLKSMKIWPMRSIW